MNDEAMIRRLRELYGLEELPVEGGLYRRTVYSPEVLPPEAAPGRAGEHRMHSAILYLLTGSAFSRLHRLASDEVYHFYMGGPAEQLQLLPDGTSRVIRLGQDVLAGERVQLLVPRGVWQGTRLCPGTRWALLGTTMAPGYEPQDYEDGDREALTAAWPDRADLIRRLT